jgi:hypothetical protein
MADEFNPIRGVNGIEVPCPSAYKQILSDVSKADSGRTEDGRMWKEKIGQLVKLELEWSYLTTAQISTVLTAFDPEYFNVEYLDAKTATFKTSEFYVGDRTAPLYNSRLGLWEGLALNIIERTPA